jgi:hypothetical protein
VWATLSAGVLSLGVLLCALPVKGETLPTTDWIKTDILRKGELLYRNGILPSGKVVKVSSRGGLPVVSSDLPCSDCHQRAGFGSMEGGVFTPPINGATLSRPAVRAVSASFDANRTGLPATANSLFQRPAYTRESLEIALLAGIDPTGRAFNNIMPRYPLSSLDMSILISYLESLSSDYSPGATVDAIKFATIITDDVSDADRQALLTPLKGFIAARNQQADRFQEFKKVGFTPTADMKYAFRRATLSVWELKGPPESWRSQMTEYYAKEPVFAVLGGISNGDWQHIHNFCEEQHLPCLFPITDFPVISETGWYTYYLSKGYFQEGESAARFVNRTDGLSSETRIVQIVQDSPAGRALASGFGETWRKLTLKPVTTLTLSKSQLSDPLVLAKTLQEHKPGVVLLWADTELVPRLPDVTSHLAAPARIFVSSSYLGKQTVTIPEAVRDKVFITYPYRLTPYVGSKLGPDSKVPIVASAKIFGDRRIASRTGTTLSQITFQAMGQLNDNLYRDYLLDIMGMMMDQVVPDYEQLSFGSGQRYASRGCYIVQLGKGASPALLPKSEWVIP